MFNRFVILALIISFFSVNALALTVNMPSELIILDEDNYFLVEITNNSSIQKELIINFFTPVESEIIAPKYIAGGSTTTAKIYVKNMYSNYTEIDSKLEIYLGSDLAEERILLKFNPTDIIPNQNNDNLSALFGFTLFFENFGVMEYTLIFILTLIALALLIAFFVRVVKR